MLLTTSLLAKIGEVRVPLGPKLVLTRFDSSETASIFRRTASSRPDICWNETHQQIRKKKWNIISNFVSILEELDVIRLWDFQSHSASGSVTATLAKSKGKSRVPSGPVFPVLRLIPELSLPSESYPLDSWTS